MTIANTNLTIDTTPRRSSDEFKSTENNDQIRSIAEVQTTKQNNNNLLAERKYF